MSDFEQRVGEAADFVTGKLDAAVDGAGDLLTGDSGKKLVGGAAVGALTAVVLPIGVVAGAALGLGYVVLRRLTAKAPAQDADRAD